jgi:hypothetical protein
MMMILLESAVRSMGLGVAIWLGLALFRVRHPNVRSLVWTVALAASLAMPALIAGAREASPHWPALTVSYHGPQWLNPGHAPAAATPVPVRTPLPAAFQDVPGPTVDWPQVLTVAYASIATFLLARLFVGLVLTWRLRRAAAPSTMSTEGCRDVWVSPSLTVPVTFGSAILLPAGSSDWSARTRQAVLAHERSHIARGDSYVQFLAQLHRAIFWFSPFAWWLADQLANLAEASCDDRAVAELGGAELGASLGYAEILLDIARCADRVPAGVARAGVAMARSSKIGPRIERILAGRIAPPLARRTRLLIVAGLAPLIVAASLAISAPAQNSDHAPAQDPAQVTVDPGILDRFVGYYELDPAKVPDMVVHITREGDRLFAEGVLQVRLELFPESERLWFVKGNGVKIAFIQEGDAPATALRFHLGYAGDGKGDGGAAKRVDAAEMARAEAAIAARKIEQSKPQVEVNVDPKIYDRYVGNYQFGQGLLTVTHEGDDLFMRLNAQPKLHAYPESDHAFFLKAVPAQISFVSEGDGPATQAILHQNGMETPFKRVDAAQAKAVEAQIAQRVADEDKPRQAVAIDPKLLDDYVGHYTLAPGYVFTISRNGNQLMAQLSGQPALEVYPDNDHEFFYTVVKAQLSFLRDGTGRVIELVLHQNGLNQVASKTD